MPYVLVPFTGPIQITVHETVQVQDAREAQNLQAVNHAQNSNINSPTAADIFVSYDAAQALGFLLILPWNTD